MKQHKECPELSYESIKDMLDDAAFGYGISDDGELVTLHTEHIGGEIVYTATWASKRTENITHYVTHWYHEDGTIEETFESVIEKEKS